MYVTYVFPFVLCTVNVSLGISVQSSRETTVAHNWINQHTSDNDQPIVVVTKMVTPIAIGLTGPSRPSQI